jgi:hypothetical protein
MTSACAGKSEFPNDEEISGQEAVAHGQRQRIGAKIHRRKSNRD